MHRSGPQPSSASKSCLLVPLAERSRVSRFFLAQRVRARDREKEGARRKPPESGPFRGVGCAARKEGSKAGREGERAPWRGHPRIRPVEVARLGILIEEAAFADSLCLSFCTLRRCAFSAKILRCFLLPGKCPCSGPAHSRRLSGTLSASSPGLCTVLLILLRPGTSKPGPWRI